MWDFSKRPAGPGQPERLFFGIRNRSPRLSAGYLEEVRRRLVDRAQCLVEACHPVPVLEKKFPR